jgi:O-antigen/teichoic acid export membrane protein
MARPNYAARRQRPEPEPPTEPSPAPPEVPIARNLLDRRGPAAASGDGDGGGNTGSGRGRGRSPLPEGTLAVGAGLVVLGLTAYVFFVIAARALGPAKYAEFSVLWTLVFFAAPGFMFPLEQEVSRAVSARRATATGGGPVVKRAAVLGAALVAGLAITIAILAKPILHELFDDDTALLIGLLIALPAYAAVHLTRGTLSGNGRFGAYGSLMAAEGLIRITAAIALAVVGVHTAGAYGLLIGLAPVVAIAVVLTGYGRTTTATATGTATGTARADLLQPGPEAPWSELSEALGWLLLGAVLAQGFVNASVPLVKLLAKPSEDAIAGQFQAGLIISRVPLFLFQAVQASLLPKLAGLAASGRFTDFRTGLRRLVAVVVAIGLAATVGGFLFGPFVLRLLFGGEFDRLGRADLGYLALASAAFMLAMALSQALIALRGHAKAAAGWAAAIAVLALITWLSSHELLLRVELGLVGGALVSVGAMWTLLLLQMRAGVPATVEPLLDELTPDHEIIEP